MASPHTRLASALQLCFCLILTTQLFSHVSCATIPTAPAPAFAPHLSAGARAIRSLPKTISSGTHLPLKITRSSIRSNAHKRLDIFSELSSLFHQNNPVSTIIYGGHTISDPTVTARCTDYIHTQETFTVGNEFFGGDPLCGVGKWVFVAYRTEDGDESQKLRFLVGWEDDSRILGDYHLTSDSVQGALEAGGESGDGVKLYAIAYGGKLINDEAVVKGLAGYAESGEAFTVGNDLFGCDPQYGSKKYGIIAYKCREEGAMKYLVAWEGERRTLGEYDC